MRAEELFEKYQHLAPATLYKVFYNPKSIAYKKGLDEEDLLQYCYIGLWKACREYNPSKNVKFNTFAINNIRWNLMSSLKQEGSFDKAYKQTRKLSDEENTAKFLYLDSDVGEGEDVNTFHDVCASDANVEKEVEENFLLKGVSEHLTHRQKQALEMRLENYTLEEIGEKFNISREAIRLDLVKAKEIINTYNSNKGKIPPKKDKPRRIKKKADNKSKLNKEKVINIKKLLLKGESIANISKMFGVSSMAISHIKNNKSWKHVKLEEEAV